MFVVDTNVLVYAAHRDAPEFARCHALLDEWRSAATPWFLTWPILYEFMRVVTHARVLEKPLTTSNAVSFVRALLASSTVRVLVATERHEELLTATLDGLPPVSGNFFHDVHTAILMREHGVRRIYTRDTGFHRFDFLEVVDPLAV